VRTKVAGATSGGGVAGGAANKQNVQAASSQTSAAAQAAAFYAVATERNLETPTKAYASGAALQFNLPPSGIGTYAIVSFLGTLSIGSGLTVGTYTASPWYPYNLLTVNYVDYLGFTRTNATGWQLHILERIKAFQFDPSVTLGSGVSTALQNVIYAKSIPTPVISTVVTSALAFSFVIPISTNRNSIRGSHLFNITGSQDIVTINCVAPLGGPNNMDSPLTKTGAGSADVVTVTGTVDLSYYYMDWPSGTVVPQAELALAHQVNSVTQNQNIAAGQQYQYLVPTGFVFSRFITEFVTGATAAAALGDTVDVTFFSFYLDANTQIHGENLTSYLARIMRLYGSSLPDGVLVTDLSSRPVNSNSYSQVAINVTLDNTVTTTFSFFRTLADGLTLQNQNLQAIGAQAS
jgi:hypothetical protein